MAGKMRPLWPDFWTDDRTVALSPFARLTFMGLWNFACDNGHIEDRSRQLKRQILPDDNVSMTALIDEVAHVHELVDEDVKPFIHRADGWITVLGADRWKTDLRWFKTCDFPGGCTKPERETRRGHGGATKGARGGHAAEERSEERSEAAAAAAAAPALDPTIDVFRAKLQAHTRLQALRFDTLVPSAAERLVRLIELHGDDRLVKVALDTCKATPPVHVSAFLGTWEALPEPGRRLAVVEQQFCVTHPWQRRTTGGVCPACASEQIAEGANA